MWQGYLWGSEQVYYFVSRKGLFCLGTAFQKGHGSKGGRGSAAELAGEREDVRGEIWCNEAWDGGRVSRPTSDRGLEDYNRRGHWQASIVNLSSPGAGGGGGGNHWAQALGRRGQGGIVGGLARGRLAPRSAAHPFAQGQEMSPRPRMRMKRCQQSRHAVPLDPAMNTLNIHIEQPRSRLPARA